MQITEVKIFPTKGKDGKLKAFASMTIDDWFVVRNVKVISGSSGYFVAMPSRKAVNNCPVCNNKNVVGSNYCNECGKKLEKNEEDANRKIHMDVAHPIRQECRLYIQETILDAYKKETTETESASYESEQEECSEREENRENAEVYAGEEVKAEEDKDIAL